MTALLRMAIFVSLFHDSASSSIPHGYLNSGKRRTRQHYEQVTVQHLDDGNEVYYEHSALIPQSRSQPRRYQSRTTRTGKVTDEEERLESERMPSQVHHIDASEMTATDSGETLLLSTIDANVHNKRHLTSHGIQSRALWQSEDQKKQQSNQIQQPQHLRLEQELNQYQYGEFGVPSSRESVGTRDREDRPKGMVVRRGRLFHNNNSKGGKRNGKGRKWSKSSKWNKSWNECYWEDTP